MHQLFSSYAIKTSRLDNAGEIVTTSNFYYCLSIGITVEYIVSQVHTQNGVVESFFNASNNC